ncbi:S1/P1 nuclease [Solitalea koreensis]|uniref:S1/P1 Nuclease n=1 Tax=Solitalea koreensis TaxID=543615 RepID=A0A521BYG1_9SPHI|nr:S1/P1 nuclease [Solitalea koreensis]SMO52239.1 S1/P1 Nuclease [Solitalea koreensis]
MKHKSAKKTVLLSAFCLFTLILQPVITFAWGPTGHRIVAEIASRHLTKKAQKAVQKILGKESLAMCSNWADFIKSDPSYKYASVWHYFDLPENISTFEQARSIMRNDATANAYSVINKMIADLKNPNLSKDKKVFAMRFLVHLIADVHQPMHCGHADDEGGNKIKVKWFGKSTNLHSVWDSDLVEFQKLSYNEYASAIDHPTREQLQAWNSTNPAQWIWESYDLSNKIYKYAEKDKKYGYRYNYDFVDALNSRLLMGGIHLANVLNEIYK